MPERDDGGRTRPPLQNRVDPLGALHAVPERGRMMGNRGGRFHSSEQTLGRRRWASRQWIACVCTFKQRKREVWANSYTELFFLDEVTALSAGHRPCFECRRQDALRFARAFAASGPVLSAAAMDVILHRERLAGGEKRVFQADIAELPDGAFIREANGPMLLWAGALHPWHFSGYGPAEAAPLRRTADVLTPPSIVAALRNGYRPGAALTPDGPSNKV